MSQQDQSKPSPLDELQRAFAHIGSHINRNINGFKRNAQQPFDELRAQAATVMHQVQMHFQNQLQGASQMHPLMASITARMAPQPVCDLALANPEEMKARLAAIPVFAVVNQNDEFVLVSGDEDAKQLGLFFFNKEDAEELIATIKEANPKLGKQTRVMMTTMDSVYAFATTPRDQTGTEGVTFRFMPDANEVESALELYRHAGIQAAGFAGVPLFQAEGLTVKSDKQRYTPLFFSKKDLDAALGDASLVKEIEQHADITAKLQRARSEATVAEGEESEATDGKTKKAARKKLETAKKRVAEYEKRLAELDEKKKLPRVDVGSLEDVLVKMEHDDKGEWNDVMFVPPGSLASKGKSGSNTSGKKK